MTTVDPNHRAPRRLDAAAAAYQFKQLDPEARWGFKAGHGTTPSQLSCLIATVVVAGGAYLMVGLLRGTAWGAFLWHEMTAYQYIPIPVIVFSVWCLAFLWIKALKIKAQRAVLAAPVLPTANAFTLTAESADAVVDRIDAIADEPDRFLYLSRVRSVLRMMRNLGRVGDVDQLLASRAEQDDLSAESGYTIVRGFIWAIPVLGFIGTVLGLTEAMGAFGSTLGTLQDGSGSGSSQIANLVKNLTGVLDGLKTGFVTTGQALVSVLAIQLILVSVKRADEQLLDDIQSTCNRTIVSRVRITEQR
jgi:biopolymer transport protein ExbB/TolQ